MRYLPLLAYFTQALKIPADTDGNFRISREIPADAFNFTVLGDWGGFPKPFYTTPIQLNSAKLLNQVADIADSQFTLAIGDNFYFWGVDSIHHPHFTKTFENIYTSRALQKPWYPLMGNHDWQGQDQIQIEYSEINYRWTFPYFYYSVEYKFGKNLDKTLKILMTDSQIQCDYKGSSAINKQYPRNPTEAEKIAQLEWLEAELVKSQNNQDEFIFVASHYEYHVPYDHKTYKCMKEVNDLMDKYQVQAHFFGHIHELSHMIPKSGEPGYGVLNYICSGNGALASFNYHLTDDTIVWNTHTDILYFQRGVRKFGGGFVMVEIAGETATVRYYHNNDRESKEKKPTYTFTFNARK